MSLFGQTKRHSLSSKPGRRAPLPIFTSDTEKRFGLSGPGSPMGASSSTWYTVVYVPVPRIPFTRSSSSDSLLNGNSAKAYHAPMHHNQRYCRLYVPLPPKVFNRIPRPSSVVRLVIGLVVILVIGLFLLGFRKRPDGRNTWSPPFTDPNSLVLTPDELAMIWEWEVSSGHYPNLSPVPENIPVSSRLRNPAVPEALLPPLTEPNTIVDFNQRTTTSPKSQLIGTGPERRFLTSWDSVDSHPGFPPRPSPGSIMDLDLVDERCNFGSNKFVRDCLELLRVGGGLDNGKRVRRGNYLGTYKHLYFEDSFAQQQMDWSPRPSVNRPQGLSRTPLTLDQPYPVMPSFDSRNPCDPLHPRVFHMFWAGPFTDKPYMAVASFLFTQNLGLDLPLSEQSDHVRGTCRPQFWVWINPGPAAAVPNPSAKREMYEALATNPWSAPFLHERFRDVVKFRMWNTTEQLDGIPELKDHWRDMPIFNSGGNVYKQPQQQQQREQQQTTAAPEGEGEGDEPKLGDVLENVETPEAAPQPKKKNGLFEKVGSASESDYDRLSVILSDMARFVLTHRFGGIYLDADTIFLRDWEELWNYRGQFAYRWSWHQKYNTAVLKMHKGSALSTFLFKTALENGLDFHPMTVSRYLKDADLEKLLFRVPDALFDPAWLNMERYQRERPPFPYFPEFSVFFSNDKFDTAGAQQVGFDGFFRGAFSYHFHNFWWLPFDPSRNFPDLGPRFAKGEKALREAQREGAEPTASSGETVREDMDDEVDLSWSTVLKRTFEGYIRAEQPNMYGEWLKW